MMRISIIRTLVEVVVAAAEEELLQLLLLEQIQVVEEVVAEPVFHLDLVVECWNHQHLAWS